MIIPAIDLIDGQVVRLFQGDYQQKTAYTTTPVDLVRSYIEQGAQWIHIVDLTGAKDPSKRQLELIKQMVDIPNSQFQTGGGIRTEQDVKDLLALGVARVVIGSVAVSQPELVSKWFEKYGAEKIVLALDINIDSDGNQYIATHGWQQNSGVTLGQLIEIYEKVGLCHVLCTDISKDGTLSGPNQSLYKSLASRYPEISWQASGGISCLDDIEQLLPNIKTSGLNNQTPSGVILGKSLLEGRFTVADAINLLA